MLTQDRPLTPFEAGEVLLINKPLQWTSFDVVRKIRNMVQTRKVGHAGTLDPLATGLLIICTGKFTRKINEYMAQEKEYTGTITLGATTPTYDLESEPAHFKPWQHITPQQIHETALSFVGTLPQVPPLHSAIKKEGKRLYEFARKGLAVEVAPRMVTIHEMAITAIHENHLTFRVVCSTGTYIRSLAHDFGIQLGCGAYLSALCRTRIGNFRLAEALDLTQAAAYIQQKLPQKG